MTGHLNGCSQQVQGPGQVPHRPPAQPAVAVNCDGARRQCRGGGEKAGGGSRPSGVDDRLPCRKPARSSFNLEVVVPPSNGDAESLQSVDHRFGVVSPQRPDQSAGSFRQGGRHQSSIGDALRPGKPNIGSNRAAGSYRPQVSSLIPQLPLRKGSVPLAPATSATRRAGAGGPTMVR